MKKNRIMRLLEPGMRAYFIIFLLFCTALLWIDPLIAAAGYALIIVEYLVYRRVAARRRREILGYIDSVTASVGDIRVGSVSSLPFPTAIIRPETGEIAWNNDLFQAMTGERKHIFDVKIGKVIPNLDLRWLIEGKSEAPSDIEIGGRVYNVYGSTVRAQVSGGVLATLNFVDCTDLKQTKFLYEESRPVVAIVLIDNYDEIMKNLSGNESSKLLVDINDKVEAWADQKDTLIIKYDRDRLLLVMEKKKLAQLTEDKFAVLDASKAISSDPIPLTLSVGVGVEGESFSENFRYAQLAIDMALSRGGDQAVIKDRQNFKFYGGQTQELQKRTKVKSRVMANALKQLVLDSSIILIMSHKMSDLDSIGAAAGVVSIARKLGKKAYIVVDRNKTAAAQLLSRLENTPEYKDVIASPTDAILMADSKTLLIVVDVNRPEVVESEELLLSCNRVAVIDHHRRSASYIDNAALNFHEPYASSASELVSELLSYMSEGPPILKIEAEAMLAGIVLDTKNFSMRTGVRTFEAAARLRMAGADTIDIKRLFQVDFDSCVDRYDIVRRTNMFRGSIAISLSENTVDRTIAAQAADELLNIQGVLASFVLFPEGNRVIVSARSLGAVNVQVILEEFGGGGHMNMAGAQVEGKSPELVLSELYLAVDEYLKTNKIQ